MARRCGLKPRWSAAAPQVRDVRASQRQRVQGDPRSPGGPPNRAKVVPVTEKPCSGLTGRRGARQTLNWRSACADFYESLGG